MLGKSVENFVEGSLKLWYHVSCTFSSWLHGNFLILKFDSSGLSSLLRFIILLLLLLLPPALGLPALRPPLVPFGLLHVSVGDQCVLDGVNLFLVFVLLCLLW